MNPVKVISHRPPLEEQVRKWQEKYLSWGGNPDFEIYLLIRDLVLALQTQTALVVALQGQLTEEREQFEIDKRRRT